MPDSDVVGSLDEEKVLAMLEPSHGKIAASVPIPPTMRGAAGFLHNHFKCQRGGACCTGEIWGYEKSGVPLYRWEVDRLAALKGLSRTDFIGRYCAIQRKAEFKDGPLPADVDEALDQADAIFMRHPCPFYAEPGTCTIHEQKPSTCAIFPVLGPTEDGQQINVDLRCPGGLEAAKKAWKEWFQWSRQKAPRTQQEAR